MTHTLTVLALLLSALNGFAQNNSNQCGEIKLTAPERVRPGENLVVLANLAKSENAVTERFDWIVIKLSDSNEIVSTKRFVDKSSISLSTTREDDFKGFTIIAVPKDPRCDRVGTAESFVSSGIFDPYYIDDFELTKWNEAYARLDNARLTMDRFGDDRLFIFIQFPTGKNAKSPRVVLDTIYEFLVKRRKMKPENMAFAVRTGPEPVNIRLQPIPRKRDSIFLEFGDIIIHGEHYEEKRLLFK